ncbi:hypothetical protein BS50DRAFT_307668 [Corynespora cassiicola Philippines]|uniref:DUF7587 domain-containing protein n=1 Tax=Corynespora cassiicola Philippines TaxID=1448308 RepID=A0A2T2NXN3_CORCC|nr:hypothetical protein BS50DRAFT_307668 [Corynespora cassiicola Philippines]
MLWQTGSDGVAHFVPAAAPHKRQKVTPTDDDEWFVDEEPNIKEENCWDEEQLWDENATSDWLSQLRLAELPNTAMDDLSDTSSRTDFLPFEESRISQNTPLISSSSASTDNETPCPPPKLTKKSIVRGPEYEPPHRWAENPHQDLVLCLLFRFYLENGDNFTKIFSALFHIDSKKNFAALLRKRFRDHLRLYAAAPQYIQVFEVSFNDPHAFAEYHTRIQNTARLVNVPAIRLNAERQWSRPAGAAAFARSDLIRQRWKALKKASNERNNLYIPMARIASKCSLQAVDIEVSESVSDADSSLTSLKYLETDTTTSLKYLETNTNTTPSFVQLPTPMTQRSLLFRTWDDDSRAKFVECGFVSEVRANWNGPFVQPFSPNDPQGRNALLLSANAHLSTFGGPSPWVTTCISLLQVVVKALPKTEPRIACIAWRPSDLPHRRMHAQDLMRWLKQCGNAQWARYRGIGEYLFWGEITKQEVLHYCYINDLNKECRRFLCLDQLVNRNTKQASRYLESLSRTLDIQSSIIIARICKHFGGQDFNVACVKDLVTEICCGWHIGRIESMDIYAMVFARELLSKKHTFSDIADAFVAGFEAGEAHVAFYKSPRTTA